MTIEEETCDYERKVSLHGKMSKRMKYSTSSPSILASGSGLERYSRPIKTIFVLQNAEKHHEGISIRIGHNITNFKKLLEAITVQLIFSTGVARKLYFIDHKNKNQLSLIKDLTDIKDHGIYLVCGAEKLNTKSLKDRVKNIQNINASTSCKLNFLCPKTKSRMRRNGAGNTM